MHDPASMRSAERVGNLNRKLQGIAERQRTSFQSARQRFALHVLHDEKRRPLLLAHVVECADVRVSQLRYRAGFTVEALAEVRIFGCGSSEDLDGDTSVKSRIAGFVNLAHATPAEERHDFVGSYSSAARDHQGVLTSVAARRASARNSYGKPYTPHPSRRRRWRR